MRKPEPSLEMLVPNNPGFSNPGATEGSSPISHLLERYLPVWLGLVILLGFAIRLAGLKWGQAYSYFGQGDAVEAFGVALNYGHGESRAQYIGQPNFNANSKLPGPLWAIFGFVCYRFWGSAPGIVLAIVLVNTAVIYFIYLLARNTLGLIPAFWSALFTATFPWVVYYSTGLYNPDMMSFLSVLLCLALWKALQTEQAPAIFWVPFLLFALPQFHLSGLLLIPAVALVLLLSPTRLNRGWLALGILSGLSLYLPYLRGELSHGWQNTLGMVRATGGGGFSVESLKAISSPLTFLVNWGPRWSRTPADYLELGRACFGSSALLLCCNLVSALVAALLIAGAVLELKEQLKGFWRSPRVTFARAPALSFFAIMLVVPVTVALLSGHPFQNRYALVLLPALIPLAAVGAARWLRRRGRIGRCCLAGIMVTSCANVWLMPALYHAQGRQIEQSSFFIPSFRQLELVYARLKNHAGDDSAVQIDDSAYLASLQPGEKLLCDAGFIRRYVAAREQDAPVGAGRARVKLYELKRAASVPEGDPSVAYRQHGVALVARPEAAAELPASGHQR